MAIYYSKDAPGGGPRHVLTEPSDRPETPDTADTPDTAEAPEPREP